MWTRPSNGGDLGRPNDHKKEMGGEKQLRQQLRASDRPETKREI